MEAQLLHANFELVRTSVISDGRTWGARRVDGRGAGCSDEEVSRTRTTATRVRTRRTVVDQTPTRAIDAYKTNFQAPATGARPVGLSARPGRPVLASWYLYIEEVYVL